MAGTVIGGERGRTVVPNRERHVQRDLVDAARHGDHEAFEALAISIGDRLFAIARLILRDEAHGELPDWVLHKTFATTRSTRQRRGLRGWLASRRGRNGTDTRRRSNVFTIATVSAVAAAAILATSALIETSPPAVPGAEVPQITVEEPMFSGSFSYGASGPTRSRMAVTTAGNSQA